VSVDGTGSMEDSRKRIRMGEENGAGIWTMKRAGPREDKGKPTQSRTTDAKSS